MNANNKKQKLLSVAVFVALNIASQAAFSAGFALIETNARGQGNAYAGAAAHTPDASTIFFNPAGMMNIDADQLVVATHIIKPNASFTNSGSTNSSTVGGNISGGNGDGGFDALVPNLYWVKVLDNDMRFGLGVNSPFGLAVKYDDDWVGRYHGVISDLKVINVNPSMSYRVNDKLSVGGGVDIMLTHVELTSAIDFAALLGQTPGSDDGYAELTGDNFSDISLGYNFGLQYQINNKSKFGFSYRSKVDVDVKGKADFTVPNSAALLVAGGLFVDTDLSASISLPSSWSLSFAHQLDDKLMLLADATWTGWSAFKELRIIYDNTLQPDSVTTEEWKDVMRYSVGLDYEYSNDLILRTGVAIDESPVPSAERRTPRLPGNDRTWVSFGLSKQLEKNMSIDVGYSHLIIKNAEVNNEFESSSANVKATLKGTFKGSVDIVSVQFNWNY